VRTNRRFVPGILVAAYGLFYAWSWHAVWRTHQTDPGDGLEYMWVFASTLPWCAAPALVGARLPESTFPAFTTACAFINATLLWSVSRWLLAPRGTPKPPRP
jgi:hypothetical protein